MPFWHRVLHCMSPTQLAAASPSPLLQGTGTSAPLLETLAGSMRPCSIQAGEREKKWASLGLCSFRSGELSGALYLTVVDGVYKEDVEALEGDQ